jgi:Holliday junction resolvase RusA-like endonuclease
VTRFVFSGDPVPASRPRFANGHTYYLPRYENALTLWRLEAATQARRMYPRDARLAVTVTFYREKRTGADVDNLCKGVLDALTGAAYADDDQVDELHAVVVRGVGRGHGRTVVRVSRARRHGGLRAELRTRHRMDLARTAREAGRGRDAGGRGGRAAGVLRDVPLPGRRRARGAVAAA